MTDRRSALPSDDALRLALTRQPDGAEAALAIDAISTAIEAAAQRRTATWPIVDLLLAGRRPPTRLVLLAILLLLAAAVVAVVGSRRSPGPFGPGANGVVAYDDNGQLRLVNADATSRRELPSGVAYAFGPTFSPDGRFLAYWSTMSSGVDANVPIDLVVMDLRSDPPSIHTLWTLSGRAGPRLAWSPDGRRIAAADIMAGVRRVFVVDVEDGVSRPIGPAGLDAWDPIWSPSGTQIGFLGGVGSSRAFYVMNADGTDPHQLSSIASRGRGYQTPAWSPANNRVAVSVEAGGADPFERDIWVLSPDDATQVDISNDPADELGPQWSPDGLRIAYLRAVAGPPATDRVVVSDADGRNATTLDPTFLRGSVAWAPDGTKLLVAHQTGRLETPVELDSLDLATGALTLIAAGGIESNPSWQWLAP
jgi:Tol biopolymer transport system component